MSRVVVEGDRDGLLAWGEYVLMRGAVGLSSRLPAPVRRGLVGGAARLACRLDARHTDAARRFVTQAFGDLSESRREELVRAAWKHLFDTVLEAERLFRDPDRVAFDFEPSDDVRRVQDEGRGGVLLSPHLGNWEAAAVALPRLGFEPVYFVSRPPRNRPLSRAFQRSREAAGVLLIPRHGALRHAARILRSGGYVVMMIDQRARIAPVVAPFFGRPAHTEQAPALLSARFQVPILVGAGLRTSDPWRFQIRVPEVLFPEDQVGRSHAEVMTDVNAAMEAMIREFPEQYFWLHDRWRKAPEPMTAHGS